MRISDWSSDVCSSDLLGGDRAGEIFTCNTLETVSTLLLERVADIDLVARNPDIHSHLLHAECGSLNKGRSEEHTSELQPLMRISYAVFCLKIKNSYDRQQTRLIAVTTPHLLTPP